MEYRKIPYVEKKVSRIFCGTAGELFTEGRADALLDSVCRMGINTFDSARNYNNSEATLGKWMESRGNREEVVLLSKCGHPSSAGEKRVNPKAIKEDFRVSTEALHTDYIDIYLLHRDVPEVHVGPIVEVFNELHEAGKIGAFGGSNWTHQRIEEANKYAYAHSLTPFSVSSPNYGLAEQVGDPWGGGCVTISGPGNGEAREWYIRNQMPVVAYSSLGRGLFSGKLKSNDLNDVESVLDEFAMRGYGYPCNFERLRRVELMADEKRATVPQIAMAYIYSQPMNVFAVVSVSDVKRMEENQRALELKLTDEELAYLDLKI